MDQFQIRVQENTKPFESFDVHAFDKKIENNRLIGLGEIPHNVSEYFDFLYEITRYALTKRRKVLLLLELPFWMDRYINSFINDQDNKIIELTESDPEENRIYSKGLIHFFHNLRKLRTYHSSKFLVCKCIDVFMHPHFKKKSSFIESIEPRKYRESIRLAALLKERKLEEYCLQREEFLFMEASSAIDLYVPEKTILYAGSYHANHVDGMPMGSMYIKPVFARLVDSYRMPAMNIRLFPISGMYGKYFKVEGQLQLGTASCDELFPEGPKNTMRELLRSIQGQSKRLITDMTSIREDQTISPEYLGYALEYDYQVSFSDVHAAVSEE